MATDLIAMPGQIVTHNACTDRCDMAAGPCACGAWHNLDEWKGRLEEADQKLIDELYLQAAPAKAPHRRPAPVFLDEVVAMLARADRATGHFWHARTRRWVRKHGADRDQAEALAQHYISEWLTVRNITSAESIAEYAVLLRWLKQADHG